MSLSKTLAGRKCDSSVWDFYCFDENANKSTCLCSVGGKTETAKTCGIKLTGKNSSNLVAHMKRFHTKAFAAYTQKECVKKSVITDGSKTKPGNSHHGNQSTLQECLNRRQQSWLKTSAEHRQRQDSLMKMFISTGYPLALLDNSAFRNMLQTLDPKFTAPSK
jgi:hypothetical protein